MSRWHADSDFDYWNQFDSRGPHVTRTCKRCGDSVDLPVDGEYPIHIHCDSCWRHMQSTQVVVTERERNEP